MLIRRFLCLIVCFGFLVCFSNLSFATKDIELLKEQTEILRKQLEKLQKQMLILQKKLIETQKRLEEAEKSQEKSAKKLERLSKKVTKAERHASADKVNLSIELEPRFWSIHMNEVYVAPKGLTASFFTPKDQGGFNGATLSEIRQGIQNMKQSGMLPKAEEVDVDNDIVRTLRFRLRMDSKVNENLRFAGRIAVYKIWGDGIGINYNQAGMHDITLDGTLSSLPQGDTLKLERAYFVYKNKIGKLGWHFSLGRRPSTEGPPLQYKKNLPDVGGSPLSSIINWEFDGASLGFNLEDITGIPGMAFKLCYGSGFESQYGTTSAFLSHPDIDDVDLFGFIATFYNGWVESLNMALKVTLNWAYAPNITDGFTGLTVMPFVAYKQDKNGDGIEEFYFEQNNGLFVSRIEPTTEIGKWQAASLLIETNLLDGRLDLFGAFSWTHTEAKRVSKNPLYEMLRYSLLSSGGDLKTRNGYGIYMGIRYSFFDLGLKLGFEYNYGSKYWFPFTGAEDNLIASKIAVRGYVFEPYLIKTIVNENFFLRLGAQFYRFEYTGSGNPLGKPVDIDEVTGMDVLFPAIEKMDQYYLSLVYRY